MKTFGMKTVIHFGDNALDRLREIPYKRVLIITDPFVVQSKMIDLITEPLAKGGIEYDIFSNVVPDAPVDKVIISCKALDHEWGIMESQEAFGTTKKAMIASGREKILVVDSTKFDQTAFSVAGKLRDIDVVVTDRKPSEKWLAHFAEEGVECRYPGMRS